MTCVKNCPRCSFLMDDHEALCATCAEPEGAAVPGRDEAISAAAPLHAGGTAVLERPTVVPLSESATFRTAGSGGVSASKVVIASVLAALLTVGVVMGVRNQGPLSVPMQRLGVIDPPVVVVPARWSGVTPTEGGFKVSMPVGATAITEDPFGVSAGMKGHVVELGPEGRMVAMSTDFGRDPAGMRLLDTDEGFASLVSLYVGGAGLGGETVRREVQISHGRALDSVLVLDDQHTTRARFMMTGGRFVVLLTEGDDSGAAALDEAHPRLVDSFDPS